jgi:hypothetical protein
MARGQVSARLRTSLAMLDVGTLIGLGSASAASAHVAWGELLAAAEAAYCRG